MPESRAYKFMSPANLTMLNSRPVVQLINYIPRPWTASHATRLFGYAFERRSIIASKATRFRNLEDTLRMALQNSKSMGPFSKYPLRYVSRHTEFDLINSHFSVVGCEEVTLHVNGTTHHRNNRWFIHVFLKQWAEAEKGFEHGRDAHDDAEVDFHVELIGPDNHVAVIKNEVADVEDRLT